MGRCALGARRPTFLTLLERLFDRWQDTPIRSIGPGAGAGGRGDATNPFR